MVSRRKEKKVRFNNATNNAKAAKDGWVCKQQKNLGLAYAPRRYEFGEFLACFAAAQVCCRKNMFYSVPCVCTMKMRVTDTAQ